MVAVLRNGVVSNQELTVRGCEWKMENVSPAVFHFSLLIKYTSGFKGEGRSIGGAI